MTSINNMRRESQKIDPKLVEIQQKILQEVQLTDFYHMVCLKPFECILEETKGGLPRGLKIVDRKDDLKVDVRPIKPILSYEHFYKLSSKQIKDLEEKHYQEDKRERTYNNYWDYCIQNDADNLLCQMKACGSMEMAICVCMYNEDKQMLNNTLLGIGQNIVKLYQKGVDPDKIVVMIVQDGIQKMDKSIEDFMQILEAESSIRFSQNKDKKLESALKQINEIQMTRQNYKWQGEDTLINLNCFLFSKQEQEKRKALRFSNVKKQYDEVKKLYTQIQQLKKDKKVTHQDLPARVLSIFKKQCKKFILGDAQDQQGDDQETLNKYFNQVSVDLNKSRPLVQNALTKASTYCQQYIKSRLQMSHVSFFRTSQFFPEDSGFSTSDITNLKVQKSKHQIKIPKDHQQEKQFLKNQFQQKLAIKMNIFFVVKYKNAQKLSSHNWFFNGFCKQFSNLPQLMKANPASITYSPKYTILLDVGLRPDQSALCKMYYALQNHQQNIGGVCGYMGLKLQRTGVEQDQITKNLDFITKIVLNFVDIQRAQQLEYHFAHLIDKGFESIFKFIHVLPGAFSGYNMKAIWGNDLANSDKLLQNYFKSIGEKVGNKKFAEVNLSFWKILARVLLPNYFIKRCIDPYDQDKQTYQQLMYESNVYLAEDRILCMGIHKNGYDLMFLPDAYSFVDPVKDIPALMGQRKRWINGSYFAFEKVSDQFSEMSCCQVLNIQMWYLSLMNVLAYVAPGFFLFSISVAMQTLKADILVKALQGTLTPNNQIYNGFVYTINFVYAMFIFGLIYFSMNLNNRNQLFVRFVYAASTVLGIVSIIMLILLIKDLIVGLGRSGSYLIQNQNQTFVQSIPGGQSTVDIVRYVVLGIMGLYALPLLLYSICFKNIRVIFEVLGGALSFAFYTPTYLIILNIYALCRMDDLSWGTKGLDSGSGSKQTAVLNCWKIIKTIHVGKLLFWNILVAGFLIHFGSNYLIRFYLTFALIVIIAVTMLFKVLCGIFYYFYYLAFIKNKKIGGNNVLSENSNLASTKYFEGTGSKLTILPSLYSSLRFKSSYNDNRCIIDDLKDQIRYNIKKLNDLSGGVGQPNMMAMQFMSMIQKNVSNRRSKQTQQFNSKISFLVSKNQKKKKQDSKKFQKLKQQSPTRNDLLSPEYKYGNIFPTVNSQQKLSEKPQQKSLLQKAKDFIVGKKDQKKQLPPINTVKKNKMDFHNLKKN